MSEMNNVQRNTIQGVNENSYMHKCYLGCMAKVTGYDIVEFLQGFIKGLKGEVGMIYSQKTNRLLTESQDNHDLICFYQRKIFAGILVGIKYKNQVVH